MIWFLVACLAIVTVVLSVHVERVHRQAERDADARRAAAAATVEDAS